MSRVSRNVRTYDHFCTVARSLELVGDRWSLLVVRDLLTGPKRFTDLMARLGGITPKTLSQRLRELADTGVVEVDREPGRREVWYQLTPVGADLAPVVAALNWWGLRHAWRFPLPGEQLHVEHLLASITQTIEHTTDDRAPARWHLRFPDGDHLVECDGERWTLRATGPAAAPNVTVTASVDAFLRFVFDRSGVPDGMRIEGDRPAVRRFERLVSRFAQLVGQPGSGNEPES